MMEKKPNESDQDFIFVNYCIPMKPYKLYIDKAPTCKKLNSWGFLIPPSQMHEV